MAQIQVRAMDHLVLAVADVERSLAWYGDVLGLEALRVEEWRRGEVFFPSVRIDEGTIIDLVGVPVRESTPAVGRNLDHFCLVVDSVDLDAVRAAGTFDVVEGPVTRWGARGDATSLYVRDPDGNVVELRCY